MTAALGIIPGAAKPGTVCWQEEEVTQVVAQLLQSEEEALLLKANRAGQHSMEGTVSANEEAQNDASGQVVAMENKRLKEENERLMEQHSVDAGTIASIAQKTQAQLEQKDEEFLRAWDTELAKISKRHKAKMSKMEAAVDKLETQLDQRERHVAKLESQLESAAVDKAEGWQENLTLQVRRAAQGAVAGVEEENVMVLVETLQERLEETQCKANHREAEHVRELRKRELVHEEAIDAYIEEVGALQGKLRHMERELDKRTALNAVKSEFGSSEEVQKQAYMRAVKSLKAKEEIIEELTATIDRMEQQALETMREMHQNQNQLREEVGFPMYTSTPHDYI